MLDSAMSDEFYGHHEAKKRKVEIPLADIVPTLQTMSPDVMQRLGRQHLNGTSFEMLENLDYKAAVTFATWVLKRHGFDVVTSPGSSASASMVSTPLMAEHRAADVVDAGGIQEAASTSSISASGLELAVVNPIRRRQNGKFAPSSSD